MKKLINFIAILTLGYFTSFAQENQITRIENDSIKELTKQYEKEEIDHFTFKDIPINGSIKQFVQELKKQNFKLVELTNVDALLTGRFTGELVQLLVQGKKETVGSITVIFPERDSWRDAKSKYNYIKSNLIEKYGEPKQSIEKFDEPYSEDLGNEVEALKEGKCTYMSNFSTLSSNGMIRVKIHSDMSVMLVYVDTQNYIKLRDQAKKDY